jgi:hypothetical protein
VVVVTGPTERPLEGLTAATRTALRRAGFTGGFGPGVVDRIAPYRDLSAPRAAVTTAELGRIANADLGLYVGVRRLDRSIIVDGPIRRVSVELQLHTVLVEPRTGATLWAARDTLRHHVRVERTTAPLPPLASDPGALRLRDDALVAIADAAAFRIAQEPLQAGLD